MVHQPTSLYRTPYHHDTNLTPPPYQTFASASYIPPRPVTDLAIRNEYPRHQQPRERSRGLDYLQDLHTELSNIDLDAFHSNERISSVNADKPLPRLPPPPPLPDRPTVPASYSASRLDDLHTPFSLDRTRPLSLTEGSRPHSLTPNEDIAPQKYFRPSAYLRIPEPLHVSRPHSDHPTNAFQSHKHRSKASTSIDITYVPSSSSEDDTSLPGTSTGRSPARRRRAASEQPPATTSTTPSKTRRSRVSPDPNRDSTPNASTSDAQRCSGFTRTGQPCKRLVRASAPYLLSRESYSPANGDGDDEAPRLVGRYCKDHAGMICEVGGFYWRGGPMFKQGSGVWIDFDGK